MLKAPDPSETLPPPYVARSEGVRGCQSIAPPVRPNAILAPHNMTFLSHRHAPRDAHASPSPAVRVTTPPCVRGCAYTAARQDTHWGQESSGPLHSWPDWRGREERHHALCRSQFCTACVSVVTRGATLVRTCCPAHMRGLGLRRRPPPAHLSGAPHRASDSRAPRLMIDDIAIMLTPWFTPRPPHLRESRVRP